MPIVTVEIEGIVSRSSSLTLCLQMALPEHQVSIKASSFVPWIIKGIKAFWSLHKEAAIIGNGEVLLIPDRDTEEHLFKLHLNLQHFAKYPILPQFLQIASRAGHYCLSR